MTERLVRIELTVLSGVSAGDIFRFDIDSGRAVSIGRAPENDLVLQDATVSRKHAQITKHNGSFKLVDMGSSHGTLHMGFRLSPGDEGARELGNGDEFKVGDAIFRVNYDESALVGERAKKQLKEAPDTSRALPPIQKLPVWRKAKVIIPAGILLLLLVCGILFGGKKAGLPKQMSDVPLSVPREGIIGFYQEGKEKDFSHLDKAQFMLPASDLLVEFDYRAEASIVVSIDQGAIKILETSPAIWQNVAIVIRDPLGGVERKLIFDNTGFPAKTPKKKWAIRDIRATPLSRSAEQSVQQALEGSIALAQALDKTPSGLFDLIRSMHRSLLQMLIESNQDASVIILPLESSMPGEEEVARELNAIIKERTAVLSTLDAETGGRHIASVNALAAKLDAELWRRIKNRWSLARIAAQSKHWIDAHDNLKAGMKMFPDELDQRWVLSDRMFNDKKVVPKKVRLKPGKYRKAEMDQ